MASSSENMAESTMAAFRFAFRGGARAGAAVAAHSHPFWQFEWMLSGRALAQVGADGIALGPGDALLIPPGLPHRFSYPHAGATWISVKFAAPATAHPPDPLLPASEELRALAGAIAALVPPGGEPAPAHRPVLDHCLAALLALAARVPAAPLDPGVAARVRRLVERDDARAWTVAGVAAALGLSTSHCSARFRRETGVALKPWLDRVRAGAAERLLAASDLPVGEVALTLGFADVFAFSRFFTRTTGLGPRAWRARREDR